MWWKEIDSIHSDILRLAETSGALNGTPLPSSHRGVAGLVIDESKGPVIISEGVRLCENVIIKGPAYIGRNCLIGNNAFIREGAWIGDNVNIGFATEIKNSIIRNNVSIGPQCFVADSKIEANAYLGAQVRTSNHRLDKRNVQVLADGQLQDSGREKLGCLIGENAALGVQVVILPGRVVAENTMIGPKIIVEKNLPTGSYTLKQSILKSKE